MYEMIQKRRNLKNKKGFTLIELIVVIVIIGILAAIVIPNLIGFKDSAAKKADLATARTLATAAATVYADDPATTDFTATNTKMKALLPKEFNDAAWKTQLTKKTMVVTVDADGAKVTDGTDTIYPESQASGKYQ